nr:uncharacterized protein LOC121470307 [Taeniopygia guttata]
MEAILEERITNCGTSRRREEKGFAHAGGTQTRPHRGAGGRSQPGGSESAGGSSRQPRPRGGRSPRGGGERRRGRGGPRPRWGERWGRGQLRGRGTAGTGLGTGAAPGVGARRGQGSGGSARRQSARRVRVARHQPLFLLLLLLLFLLRPQSSEARRRYRPGSRHGNNDLARWKHHPSLRIVAPECVRNLKVAGEWFGEPWRRHWTEEHHFYSWTSRQSHEICSYSIRSNSVFSCGSFSTESLKFSASRIPTDGIEGNFWSCARAGSGWSSGKGSSPEGCLVICTSWTDLGWISGAHQDALSFPLSRCDSGEKQ